MPKKRETIDGVEVCWKWLNCDDCRLSDEDRQKIREAMKKGFIAGRMQKGLLKGWWIVSRENQLKPA